MTATATPGAVALVLGLVLAAATHTAAFSPRQLVVAEQGQVVDWDTADIQPPVGSVAFTHPPPAGCVVFTRSVMPVAVAFDPGVEDHVVCMVSMDDTHTPLWCGPLRDCSEHFRFEAGAPEGRSHVALLPTAVRHGRPPMMVANADPVASASFVAVHPAVVVAAPAPDAAVRLTAGGVSPPAVGFAHTDVDGAVMHTVAVRVAVRDFTDAQLTSAASAHGLPHAPHDVCQPTAGRRVCVVVSGRTTCWSPHTLCDAAALPVCSAVVHAPVPVWAHTAAAASMHVTALLVDRRGDVVASSGSATVVATPPATPPPPPPHHAPAAPLHPHVASADTLFDRAPRNDPGHTAAGLPQSPFPAVGVEAAPLPPVPHTQPRWWSRASLQQAEWSVFSQNGEDGLLWLLLSLVGAPHRTFVEFGVEDGRQCNTRLLQESLGWRGVLMDAGYSNAAIGLHQQRVLPSTVNDVFQSHGVPSRFDVLSIDIDWADFYVWRALNTTRFQPRVVAIEFNSHLPPTDDRVVCCLPRQPLPPGPLPVQRDGCGWDGDTNLFGAGIRPLATLSQAKGYTLVYCESHGVNCLLLRTDVFEAANVALGRPRRERPPLAEAYHPPNYHGDGFFYGDADDGAAAARGIGWGHYAGEPWDAVHCAPM